MIPQSALPNKLAHLLSLANQVPRCIHVLNRQLVSVLRIGGGVVNPNDLLGLSMPVARVHFPLHAAQMRNMVQTTRRVAAERRQEGRHVGALRLTCRERVKIGPTEAALSLLEDGRGVTQANLEAHLVEVGRGADAVAKEVLYLAVVALVREILDPRPWARPTWRCPVVDAGRVDPRCGWLRGELAGLLVVAQVQEPRERRVSLLGRLSARNDVHKRVHVCGLVRGLLKFAGRAALRRGECLDRVPLDVGPVDGYGLEDGGLRAALVHACVSVARVLCRGKFRF